MTVAKQVRLPPNLAAPSWFHPISCFFSLDCGPRGCPVSFFLLETGDHCVGHSQEAEGEMELWDATRGGSRPERGPGCRSGMSSNSSPRAEWSARRLRWWRGVPHTSQLLWAAQPLGGHSTVWSLSRRKAAKLGSCKENQQHDKFLQHSCWKRLGFAFYSRILIKLTDWLYFQSLCINILHSQIKSWA